MALHRAGKLSEGWSGFYGEPAPPQRTLLRTYGPNTEKFCETFKLPQPPEPRHKKFAPPPSIGCSWGIGGTYKSGRLRIEPPSSKEFTHSSRRYLECKKSDVYAVETAGNKAHVFNDQGVDMRVARSDSYLLDDMLQRKGRVPEEMRSEARSIHRMAPPGLKGYMGAEYSNDYFKHGASVPVAVMRPTREDKVPPASCT